MDVPERAAICVKDSPCIRFSFSRLILRRSFLSFLVFLPHFRRYMSDTEDAKVAKLPVSALVFSSISVPPLPVLPTWETGRYHAKSWVFPQER